jgi:hypothetical protein
MLPAPVLLGDREVVLERGVRLVEGVGELVALEDVVLGTRLADLAELRVDCAADGPDAAGLALDPDDDGLGVSGVVHAVEYPLGEPTVLGRGLHDPTIQSPRC